MYGRTRDLWHLIWLDRAPVDRHRWLGSRGEEVFLFQWLEVMIVMARNRR